ncbi:MULTISPECIES: 16S rRNA (guanine(527)-N(7))-methyltransferase RsmG [Acidobacterium]|uniref:Ribosomal RNA small subunit methyltransferase G n=1 Tax=Acidobacterium capsulatum (strain ATCC 51196 / DSM 11244 / BCRC 80197 / JCM 7670 / NBRC 15755 / NCIMB 13165 / 161) TaxID=240015 RepID=C1F9L5_ACIC5|nr:MULTISPECIES: 16S rRNA (guanine(527)-N(7))-methyltransferase RsmG [Acidobacterium]ACO31765.1 methyltransferase GidB [Acidobacterium capsulatum ATCC 51196]HCT62222.1 16S rRNA (guanine(527)-N(7))-methyltransferase RsmG [Acidobacterium sp.]
MSGEVSALHAERIGNLLEGCGTPVSGAEAERLGAFLALLLKWNARTNLTAIREPEQMVRRHFADSVFCARNLPEGTKTLLDFGSGGGFPGIPVALLRPEVSVTLAESQGRKASFLREAVRSLGLRAEVWAERVEEMPVGRCFDCVTLRAVDRMLDACRAAAERVAAEGTMMVFTTERLREEAKGVLPGWSWPSVLRLPHAEQGLLLVGSRMMFHVEHES